MSKFWEKLTAPVPFYTVENVNATIEYIDKHTGVFNKKVFKSALLWVRSVLTNTAFRNEQHDRRLLIDAHDEANDAHDKAISQKDFIAAVRWRYVMAALNDYTRGIIAN